MTGKSTFPWIVTQVQYGHYVMATTCLDKPSIPFSYQELGIYQRCRRVSAFGFGECG